MSKEHCRQGVEYLTITVRKKRKPLYLYIVICSTTVIICSTMVYVSLEFNLERGTLIDLLCKMVKFDIFHEIPCSINWKLRREKSDDARTGVSN